jgi:hypothetical protein
MPRARLVGALRTGSGALGGRTAGPARGAPVMALALAAPRTLPLALRPIAPVRATAVALTGVTVPLGGPAAGLPLGSARQGRVDGGGRRRLSDFDLLTAKLGNQLT